MKRPIVALLILASLIPSLGFAQTASSTPASPDVAVLIAGLQEQIKELQRQLDEIQRNAPLEVTTSPEFAAVNVFTQTLSRGMFSEEVKELQRVLAQNPEVYPEGIISGYFGALTELAVKRYQEANGVEAVGIVGPKTRALLNENISSSGGGGGVAQPAASPEQAVGQQNAQVPTSTPSTLAKNSSTSATTTANGIPAALVPPPPSPPASTGSYFVPGGYYNSVLTYVSEPTPSAPAPSVSTSTASSTPPEAPTPSPSPEPSSTDATGPTITSLSITPVSTTVGGAVSFSAVAEDPSGIQSITYIIRYPTDASHNPYYHRPNCNFNGVTSGTCGFGEPIDDGIQNPSLLGVYAIESVRAVDMLGNTSTYYPDGTVTNGVNVSHSLTIPGITISAP